MNVLKKLFRRMRRQHQAFNPALYRPSSELHRHAEERARNECRLIEYAVRRLGRWA